MSTDQLWRIVTGTRNGILATVNPDGLPQLSNVYYLADRRHSEIKLSTTADRVKGRNLRRDPRAVLHVSGADFFNFAVVEGDVTLSIPAGADDEAVDELFEIHASLGAAVDKEGFGARMIADHRMVARLHVERIYGQILKR